VVEEINSIIFNILVSIKYLITNIYFTGLDILNAKAPYSHEPGATQLV